MRKFQVQGVGLDTTNINHPFGDEEDWFDYIYTSISANNDFILKDSLKHLNPEPPLIVYVEFLENLSDLLNYHLNMLGRDQVDLLLFDAELKPEDIEKEMEGFRSNVRAYGVKDVKSVKQLESFLNIQTIEIRHVGLNISPTDFNYEVVEFCRDNRISLFGFNPIGGYLSSARNINAFTIPYLLSFAAANCDVVILSGRDTQKAWEDMKFLRTLRDSEYVDDSLYELEKKVYKPASSLPVAIKTAVDLGHGYKLPYVDPHFSTLIGTDIITSFKTTCEYPSNYVGIYEVQPDYIKVQNILALLNYKDSWPQEIRFAYARYNVMNYFEQNYPHAHMEYVLIGKTILLINFYQPTLYKGAFLWQKIVQEEVKGVYILANPENNKIIWRQADEEDLDEEIDVVAE
jgi:hypothetical protein